MLASQGSPWRAAAQGWAALLLVLMALPLASKASEPPSFSPEQFDFFESQVRPLLVTHCYECHSSQSKSLMGGLHLDNRQAALDGGESGPAVVPGKPEESLIVEAVRFESFEMPPQGKLPEQDVETLVKWVSMGAPWPEAAPSEPVEHWHKNYDWQQLRASHWAWQPVQKPLPPPVQDAEWPQSPIDYFVLARLEAAGLKPAPPADKQTLVRRVYFDLLGLPPSPEEVAAFVSDDRPEAFAELIDRLLESPHYGEKWGRHWLDVARYSDGYGGFSDSEPLPHAWRYRDWVVEALNRDLPYDEFLRQQIAGDLLGVPRGGVATGLFAIGPTYQSDGGNAESIAAARAQTLDDRVDTLTRGLLGVTVSCARCHDHKFDPIPQQDYYSLAGIFNNTRSVGTPLVAQQVVAQYHAHQDQIRAQDRAIELWLDGKRTELSQRRLFESGRYLEAVADYRQQRAAEGGITDLRAYAGAQGLDGRLLARWDDFLQSSASREALAALRPGFDGTPADTGAPQSSGRAGALAEELNRAIAALRLAHEALAGAAPDLTAQAALQQAKERLPPEQKHLLEQALRVVQVGQELEALLSAEERAKLAVDRRELDALRATQPPPYPIAHTLAESGAADMNVALRGNLLKPGELAPRRFLRILAGEQAPRFTQGSGRLDLAAAVASADNPLTARVMVNRVWLHLLGEGIVRTPSNFGTLGQPPTHPQLLDWLAATFVENAWSLKALQRTILLSSTYQMSSQFSATAFAVDGDNRLLWRANVRKLPIESWRDALLTASGELDLTIGGEPLDDLHHSRRRTLYTRVSRSGDRWESDELLRLFDFPSPRATSDGRTTSIVPQQFLFMLNSPFVAERAKALAARLFNEAEGDAARIERAYQLLYSRSPTETEKQLGLAFVANDAPLEAEPVVEIVLADFEANNYGDWQAEGTAFGTAPARGTLPGQASVIGYRGRGLANSYLDGDRGQGTLTSPTFKIEKRYLKFLLGGGHHPGETCINLVIDGQIVRTATGNDREELTWQTWDLDDLQGRTATIEIVDRHRGGWGHISVDQIVLSDEPGESAVRWPTEDKPRLTRWQQYAQVLLCANEFFFLF